MSLDRLMDKENMVYIYNGILFNLKEKKKKIPPYATIWMNLEAIMLSEISLSQSHNYCMIPLIRGIS